MRRALARMQLQRSSACEHPGFAVSATAHLQPALNNPIAYITVAAQQAPAACMYMEQAHGLLAPGGAGRGGVGAGLRAGSGLRTCVEYLRC